MDKAENAMVTITKERYDHFIWEIERLRKALKKANENHEHFQREWYLRGDEIERLRQMLFAIRGKVPLELLHDENGKEKPLVDAVDAMLVEIVSLRIKLRKALGGNDGPRPDTV